MTDPARVDRLLARLGLPPHRPWPPEPALGASDAVSRKTVSPVSSPLNGLPPAPLPRAPLPRDGAIWTASEEAILIDGRAKGWRFKELARILRRPETGVRIKASRLGLARPWRNRTRPSRSHPATGVRA